MTIMRIWAQRTSTVTTLHTSHLGDAHAAVDVALLFARCTGREAKQSLGHTDTSSIQTPVTGWLAHFREGSPENPPEPHLCPPPDPHLSQYTLLGLTSTPGHLPPALCMPEGREQATDNLEPPWLVCAHTGCPHE